MKSEVHDRFYCYNCGGECFNIHEGSGRCKGFGHEEVGCGVTWKSPEDDWKFFGYSVHVGFESQEEYEASQKAEYFDPTFSFEEQQDAMRWAFLEAVRCCRSAKATEGEYVSCVWILCKLGDASTVIKVLFGVG